MEFLKDECGQGAAEYIIVWGCNCCSGAALLIYKNYLFPTYSIYHTADELNTVMGVNAR
jgi:hypothetical protein